VLRPSRHRTQPALSAPAAGVPRPIPPPSGKRGGAHLLGARTAGGPVRGSRGRTAATDSAGRPRSAGPDHGEPPSCTICSV
jgi:hypothetical protein